MYMYIYVLHIHSCKAQTSKVNSYFSFTTQAQDGVSWPAVAALRPADTSLGGLVCLTLEMFLPSQFHLCTCFAELMKRLRYLQWACPKLWFSKDQNVMKKIPEKKKSVTAEARQIAGWWQGWG